MSYLSLKNVITILIVSNLSIAFVHASDDHQNEEEMVALAKAGKYIPVSDHQSSSYKLKATRFNFENGHATMLDVVNKEYELHKEQVGTSTK